MYQQVFGGSNGSLNATNTRYNLPMSGLGWTAENVRSNLISTDGKIFYLRVRLGAAPGAGKSYTFTMRLNGAPTTLTFTISNLETSGFDIEHSFVITGGDKISLECDPTGTPTVTNAKWSWFFVGDNPNESLICGGSMDVLNSAATEYAALGSPYSPLTGTETNFRQIMPTSGTLKNLYVDLTLDPGGAPDAYGFTVRVNIDSPVGGLVVDIVADDRTGNDLVNTIAVVAGDVLTMMIEQTNTPTVTPQAIWGVTFVADIDGESVVLGGSSDDLDTAATEYNGFSLGSSSLWGAVEGNYNNLGQPCTLRKLHVLLENAPGVGKKYVFTIRVAGADSNVATTVDEGNTTGNSGALTDEMGLDEYAALQVVPTGAPAIGMAFWGFVSYNGPSTPEGGASASTIMAMLIKAEII